MRPIIYTRKQKHASAGRKTQFEKEVFTSQLVYPAQNYKIDGN
jgi:hypothetical protein